MRILFILAIVCFVLYITLYSRQKGPVQDQTYVSSRAHPQQSCAPLCPPHGNDRIATVRSSPHSTNYVILDTETTGLSPYTDRIIQISAIRYNELGKPVASFDTLLNPCCPIPPHVTQINGITNQMVAFAPCADQIRDGFLSFLGDDLIVGYNVTFDLRFLNQTFPGFFSGRCYVDALSLVRKSLLLPSYKLEHVASEVGFSPDGAFHDSFTDCEAVAAILRHIEVELSSRISIFDAPTSHSQPRSIPDPWEQGFAFWRQGEELRKDGRFEDAIQLYNRARSCGYTAPVLYESYAMVYRREGKFEEEIAILEEGLQQCPSGAVRNSFLERKTKAQDRLTARLKREEALRAKEEERSRKAEARRLKRELEAAKPKQPSRRPVLQCDDDGTILHEFPSLADASRQTGVSTKCIRDCASGRQRHAEGYCWRYLDVTTTGQQESNSDAEGDTKDTCEGERAIWTIEPRQAVTDESHPFYQKKLVFTGTLKLPRHEAAQMAVDRGAVLSGSVSKKTDYLIVGEQDPVLVGEPIISSKEKRAIELNDSGEACIHIIREEEFLRLLHTDSGV